MEENKKTQGTSEESQGPLSKEEWVKQMMDYHAYLDRHPEELEDLEWQYNVRVKDFD